MRDCSRIETIHWSRGIPRDFSALAAVLLAAVVLTACGGTPAKPTANDAATIAAANTASVSPAGTGTSAVRTPGAGTTMPVAGGPRGFGGLLTPVSGTATSVSTRVPNRAVTPSGIASSTAGTSGAMGTPGASASAQSPPLDPCVLMTQPEVSMTMGEPFSQASNTAETPSTNPRLSGYSSASCAFTADASTQAAPRAVETGTIRCTPATNPPTGAGTFPTIGDVWNSLKQQAQGNNGNPAVLTRVGDEAFAITDTSTVNDEDVYVRKGEVLLLVVVTGYDMGARDKAVAVAT